MPRQLVLIDDDSDFALLVEAALIDSGWEFAGFTDVDFDAAADHLALHRPDVLIVDIRMPLMNGNEVLDLLAERDLLGGIRLFASSSVEPPRSIWRPFEHHSVEFISKERVASREGLLEALESQATPSE